MKFGVEKGAEKNGLAGCILLFVLGNVDLLGLLTKQGGIAPIVVGTGSQAKERHPGHFFWSAIFSE